MTTTQAILFATERVDQSEQATALLALPDGETVIESLIGKLRDVGLASVTVVSRPAWAGQLRERGLVVVESKDVASDIATVRDFAVRTEARVVLGAADLVAHRTALAKIAGVRVRGTSAAIQAGTEAQPNDLQPPIFRDRDLVISVGTHDHEATRANAVFRGILGVSAADRAGLISACDALLAEADESGRDLDETAGSYGATTLVLLALARTGVSVSGYHVRFVRAGRVGSAASALAAAAALDAVNEQTAKRKASVKEDDEFFATYTVQSWTPFLAAYFARIGVTPTAVTWISVLFGVGTAACYATGVTSWMILGSVLLYFSFAFDCCDGQVARYTGGSSRYGGWFDMIADRCKEYIVFVGFAIGGARIGEKGVWGLAIAAMILQTVRHEVDTWYGAMQDTATRSLAPVPLSSRLDRLGIRAQQGAAASGGIGGALTRISVSTHARYRSPGYWIKRSLVLPIGDRWLIIGLAAPIFGPRGALITVLCVVSLSFLYVFSLRTLRARSMGVPALPRFGITKQRDDGPIARVIGAALNPVAVSIPSILINLGLIAWYLTGHDLSRWTVLIAGVVALGAALGAKAPHTGRLDWLTPAGLRASEYTFIALAGIVASAPLPLVFALIASVVMYHYDLAGRIEKTATPIVESPFTLGWDGRVTLLTLGVLAGLGTATFAVLTVYTAGLLVAGTTIGLVRRPAEA